MSETAATALAKTVDLTSYRPRTLKVIVGAVEIAMGKPNVLAVEAVLQALASMDLDKLVAPIADMVSAVDEARGVAAPTTVEIELPEDATPEARAAALEEAAARVAKDRRAAMESLIERFKAVGPGLIDVARPVLGRQLMPAITRACVAVLDTRAMLAGLTAGTAPVIPDPGPADTDEDGTYLGHPKVRAWIKENLSVDQAVLVFTAAWDLAGLVSAVGNLMGAFLPKSAPENEAPTTTH